MPLPALPAAFCTPVLASVITLMASVTSAVGVRVAVHVMPPSAELTVLSVPFSTIRSELLKPVTASENVIVTSEVSPAFNALSATTTVAVGSTVAIA